MLKTMTMLHILVLSLLSLSAAQMDFQIKAVHNIEEFKAENPDVKLEKMFVYDHIDQSRSYSMGSRQTGMFYFYVLVFFLDIISGM